MLPVDTTVSAMLLPDLTSQRVMRFVVVCDRCSHLCVVLSQVLEGRPIYVDCYGNLAPLTKGGQQLVLNFYAFKENRLPFCVKVLQFTHSVINTDYNTSMSIGCVSVTSLC